jgi:hypothetical protein
MLYNHFLREMNVMLTVAENRARNLRLTVAGADSDDAERGSRRSA